MTATNPVQYSKTFISFSNSDAIPDGSPTNFAVQFNNNSITNYQSNTQEVKTHLTPICFSLNWTYYNISSARKNNQIKVSSAGFSSVYTVVLPDGIYNGATLADALTTAMNTANAGNKMAWTAGATITWTVSFLANTSQLKFQYVIDAGSSPSGSPNVSISALYSGVNMIKELGLNTNGVLVLTYASKSSTAPYTVDLMGIETILIHSNVAKSFYSKRNGVLSQDDVLFEIPVMNTPIGSTIYFQPATPDSLRQEVISNIDFMTIRITDKYNQEVLLDPSTEVSFIFALEREIVLPDKDDRIRASMNYLSFNKGS